MISMDQIITTIGHFNVLRAYMLLESKVDADEVNMDAVSGMAGVIDDYGITVVLSAVLILFAVVMFNMIVRRSVNSEQILILETQKIAKRLDNVENILGHETNSSEVFDRLNGKVTQGFDEIARDMDDMKHDIKKIYECLDHQKNERQDTHRYE